MFHTTKSLIIIDLVLINLIAYEIDNECCMLLWNGNMGYSNTHITGVWSINDKSKQWNAYICIKMVITVERVLKRPLSNIKNENVNENVLYVYDLFWYHDLIEINEYLY